MNFRDFIFKNLIDDGLIEWNEHPFRYAQGREREFCTKRKVCTVVVVVAAAAVVVVTLRSNDTNTYAHVD